MNLDDTSDINVIEKIRNGDKEAFIDLVDKYKRKVVSLCYSYAEDYHEAEDISQEVFLSFFRSIDSFRGDCSISTYIYKIAVSRCLDFKRKKNIKGFLTGLFNTRIEEQEDFEEKNYIRQCINLLPKDLKTPIVLFYYIGLSHKEIGDILNVSAKTVEGRIYRAKNKLKAEFEKEGYEVCKRNGII
ncbi:MAG: RNA polymerase sigma factor [Bacillota bacterium]|nr:RNA polymerase sigma factor [Bacillota bacterium]